MIGSKQKYLKTQRLAAEENAPTCRECGEQFPIGRARLGYDYCLVCGENHASRVKHTIVPIPKSNYVYAATAADVLSPYSHKGNR